MELKGIGKVRASNIIRSRREKGAFIRIEELSERKLVPKNVFKAIRGQIGVSGKTSVPSKTALDVAGFLKTEGLKGRFWLLSDERFFEALSQKIEGAKRSILITSFVFKTSDWPQNRAVRVLEALKKAAVARNVKVEILLERSDGNLELTESNRSTASRFSGTGVDVRLDDPRRTLHAKIAVIDETWTFLGSHNLTHSALGSNAEVSILVHSKPLAKRVSAYVARLK